MKNFSLLILGIILGVVAASFYYNSIGVGAPTEQLPPKPYGYITSETAKKLDEAYNERYSIINDSLFKDPKEEDNRSSWYKLQAIEEYLAYTKYEAKQGGYTLDGLRLYLGAYPDSKEGRGLTTMFFVPTGYKTVSDGSIFSLQGGGKDLPGFGGLNLGSQGTPPGANYPQ